MAETKTKFTAVKPKDFVAKVPNETRRKDAQVLLKLFEKVTGWKPQMYGPTIVGFGTYEYTYDSGHTGKACVVGFSPRGSSLAIYSGMMATSDKAELATHRRALDGVGRAQHGIGYLATRV